MKILLIAVLVVLLVGAFVFFVIAPPLADKRFNAVAQSPPYTASGPAHALHERLFVADLHADMLLWNRDPLERHGRGHVDVPRLLAGNVGLQVFSVVTKSPWGQNYERNEADSDRITLLAVGQRWPAATWRSLKERTLYQAEKLRRAAARSGGTLTIIRTAADLERFLARRAENPELVAGLLAIEGLHALEDQFTNVDVFFEAGYRMMAPTHLFDTALGGAAAGVDKGGLTAFGRRVIERMEERGIIVDLAHASPALLDDVLDMATRPVVVSHTGVQGTCPGPRNLSDAHLRRIADNGGVIGIGYWEGAVCGIAPADIVRAIRYTVDLIGIDHVGLGSDFDGTVRTQFDTSGLVLITEALLDAGFTDEDIAKVMGGNVLRLLRETLPPPETGFAEQGLTAH